MSLPLPLQVPSPSERRQVGYQSIMLNLTRVADYLADEVKKFDGGKRFTIMSDGGGAGLPLVAWRLTNKENFDEFAIARTLRERCVHPSPSSSCPPIL